MKKLIIIIAVILSSQFSILNSLFAQSPQSFKYQSVVRTAAGVLAVNQIISVRTSILAGSAIGSSVYTETQTLSTNDYGVVSLNIGAGTTVSGNFATINWGSTDYFVKTELDITGGATYVFMGTSQILSVPYALYAEKAGNATADHDTSATNELQTLSVIGNNLSITNGNTVALPPDADNDSNNELQTLHITGDSLHITNGNTVYLSGAVDLDASPTNEIQNLSVTGGSVNLSLANSILLPDSSATNELQNISLTGGTLTLSQTNSVLLPDSSATNEIQNLNINGGQLSISQSNSISLPDSSDSNELQNLTLTPSGTLSITQGNSVAIPDMSDTNEIQSLSVINDTMINISNGNSAYINTSRSLKFPEGIDGEPIVLIKDGAGPAITYVVPPNKNFYLSNKWDNQSGNIFGFPVFPSGTTITLTNPYYLCGVLVDKIPAIQIINSTVSNTSTYIVPSGKTLFIKSFGSGLRTLFISGAIYNGSTSDIAEILMFDSGTTILSTSSSPVFFTGYLK